MVRNRPINIVFGRKKGLFDAIKGFLPAGGFDIRMADLATDPLDGCDAIVPLTLADQAALRGRTDTVVGRAIVPAADAVETCDDKLRFNRVLLGAGFGSHIPSLLDPNASTPFILKRRRDEFGANSHLVRTAQDRDKLADLMLSADYFAQTYIEGDTEWTTHLLMRHGRPAFDVTVAYQMATTHYVKSVNCQHRALVWHERTPFLDLFTQMLDVIGLRDGACCVNYKIADGEPLVFEVNPRLGGSMPRQIERYLTAYLAALGMDGADAGEAGVQSSTRMARAA